MSHAWAWERDLQRLNDLEKRVKVNKIKNYHITAGAPTLSC
jgi:hypothetical protein